jgi:hypothetical protein
MKPVTYIVLVQGLYAFELEADEVKEFEAFIPTVPPSKLPQFHADWHANDIETNPEAEATVNLTPVGKGA